MDMGRNKGLLPLHYVGLLFLILGLVVSLYYIPQATESSTDSHLLDTLRYICLGISLELFGLGLMIFDRK
jgi:hypothetical protein